MVTTVLSDCPTCKVEREFALLDDDCPDPEQCFHAECTVCGEVIGD